MNGVLAVLPRTPITEASTFETSVSPFVRLPVAISVSDVELGMGSCDGLATTRP